MKKPGNKLSHAKFETRNKLLAHTFQEKKNLKHNLYFSNLNILLRCVLEGKMLPLIAECHERISIRNSLLHKMEKIVRAMSMKFS